MTTTENKATMTQENVLKWIAELFEESPDQLTPHTRRDDVPAWDSLGVLTLMASLDSEYGIVLTDEELHGMKRVDDILSIFRQRNKLDES